MSKQKPQSSSLFTDDIPGRKLLPNKVKDYRVPIGKYSVKRKT